MDLWQYLMSLFGGGGGGGTQGAAGTIDPSTGYPVPYDPTGAAGSAFLPGGTGSGGGTSLQSLLAMLPQLLMAGGGAYYGANEIQQLQRLYGQQQQNNQIAMNPVAMANRAAAATLPINKQLAYTVNQAADLGTAQAGMAQSPGAVASARAQALAPYAEQNLQTGVGLAEFGFPFEAQQQVPNYLSVLNQLQTLGRGSVGLPGIS